MPDPSREARSERQKMLAGEPYDPADPELSAMRRRSRALCHELNGVSPAQPARLGELRDRLFGRPVDAVVTPPFHCDYGVHIEIGRGVYFNVACVVLDVAPVRIGDHVLFGPAVQVYTATHPLSARARRSGLELGRPVTIEDDVWIGGGSVICPGVRIGARSVIGAGSVVTRDIPADVLAVGNPCRVVRTLGDND